VRSPAAGGWSSTEYTFADGLTQQMLDTTFACNAPLPGVTATCLGRPCPTGPRPAQVTCKVVEPCPVSITLSVRGVADPTRCIVAGTYTVRVNETLPTGTTFNWQIDGGRLQPTPTPELTLTLAANETTQVLVFTAGTCTLARSLQLQECGALGGENPNGTTTNPPAPPATTTNPTPQDCIVPAGCTWCFIWMIVNLILIAIGAIAVYFAVCAPNPGTITAAIVLGLLALASTITWLILCGAWLTPAGFCSMLFTFLFWLTVLDAITAAITAVLQWIGGCAAGAAGAFGYITILILVCTWVFAAAGCAP